ncbi:MAG TPA: alpha/beta fold hydrolase [Candidatus Dormibacteraeota bacterium]|nr:alpha/beta fold hydrolase [Candidatus Dormibacteraeota bacterium]
MGEARWLTVRAAGGRDLEVLVDGPDRGTVLLFHYGTPSAAVRNAMITAPAAKRGLRTVVYSRPGYASSTPNPGRAVADAAQDSETILDALAADRFVTVGWSGGGPHALACAALLSERCLAAATIGSVAPNEAEGLDWSAGMGPENIAEFAAAVSGEQSLGAFLEKAAEGLREVTGPEVAAALGGLVSQVDKDALSGEFGDILADSFRRSVSTGIAGWRDDDLAFVRPWGFELTSMRVPVAIWQGAQDLMVPYDHGRWLSAHVTGAQQRLLEDEGHLSLLKHIDRILEDLVELGTA